MDPDLTTILNRYINELAAANHKVILAESRADAAEARVAELEEDAK